MRIGFIVKVTVLIGVGILLPQRVRRKQRPDDCLDRRVHDEGRLRGNAAGKLHRSVALGLDPAMSQLRKIELSERAPRSKRLRRFVRANYGPKYKQQCD